MKESAPPNDPLSGLEAFDRLEIGPVRIEPNRLTAAYRVWQANAEHRNEFICRYEEPVFEPGEAESENLGAMIAAQVALNYGLFCRQIVFHGPYDETDRRLLREMAENTAREIYVKKFLQPNPFLIDAATRLPALKKERYCRAALRFRQTQTQRKTAGNWRLWKTAKSRHAVLSSGGKDSLLTFGLLQDIGCEVHPVFVNESGRHWFTALNAYRHFKTNIPHTARVWINSDRIFQWMLGRLPFIRKNAAGIRADSYPIRLWTVAVFLFSVLPILRKRNIGRLLIGNEYDTTVLAREQGIRHYDGLYDQSLYFDTAFSRYFMRKGWAVSQFSVLRTMSELLIQKVLSERYPLLLQHQISCHAAHKGSQRIEPCGRCEKCRRIVSMLTALDGDPKRCGYNEAQIAHCLENFARHGISQERASREHVGYLLLQKELIRREEAVVHCRAHPEVLQLRFDPPRSPMDAIPVDLRKPLFTILNEHGRGAVFRSGQRWRPFDWSASALLQNPYPFELEAGETAQDPKPPAGSREYLWGELTWQEARRRLAEVDVGLLPVGSLEQHGPHLPLDTDTFDADYLARRVAMACSQPVPLVLPVVPYGVSYHHENFPGTVGMQNETLARLVYEIGMDLARNGIRKLVIVNGHGGNGPALNFAAQMINRDAHIFVCVDSGESSDVDVLKMVETPNDVHAGEFETSTSLAVRAALVHMQHAVRSVPTFSSRYLDFTGKRVISWYAHTQKLSASGVMGDPTRATAEKGARMWEIMVAHLVALVEDLKAMTLDEIYQQPE